MSKNVKDLSVLMRVPYQLSSQAQLSSVEPFFNRPGYEVSGWVDAMGKKYETDYRFENFKEKNVALSAEWELLRYGITYQLNGHGEAPEKSEYTVLEEYTPPDLTATGWSFQGWQPPKIDVGTTGNKTFTAGWLEVITGSVSFSGQNTTTLTATINVTSPASGYTLYKSIGGTRTQLTGNTVTFTSNSTCTFIIRGSTGVEWSKTYTMTLTTGTGINDAPITNYILEQWNSDYDWSQASGRVQQYRNAGYVYAYSGSHPQGWTVLCFYSGTIYRSYYTTYSWTASES